MRLRRGTAVLALGLASVLSAEAAEVRDMLGRRVTVPERPVRIVSLAPSVTETVYALGAGSRLVGVTQHCDFPPEARAKPRVGGIYDPNFELILSLRPDLVLATSEGNREEHVRGLEGLGLPVYVVRPTDLATVLESIERVGRLLGREAEADRLVGSMRRETDRIERAVRGARRPRVLYVVWGSPLIVPGRDTLITDLIRRAGGDSVTGDEPFPYPRFSVEEAVARKPERIVLAQHSDASIDDRLREWHHLTLIPAVRQGHIRPIDGDLVHRPGPRVLEGLRALARAIHPEAAGLAEGAP